MNNQNQSKIMHSIKKTAVLVLFIGISASMYGQSLRTEVEIFQEVIGLEKKVAVADFMNLDESANGFWEIYNEYEVVRKKQGEERIKIIYEYAKAYPNLADEKILELYKRTNSMRKASDKLLNKYFKKMKKEVGISKAAQFWQIENYFNAMVQSEINSRLPFIGEN